MLAGASPGSSVGIEVLVEGLPAKALRPFPQIRATRPVEDVRQLPHHVQRQLRRGRLVAVHRHVARVPDVLRLLPHDLGDERTEGGFAEVSVQFRDLGWVQGLVHLVDTLDQALQRMPCMEAGRPRVAVDVALRIARALRRMRELLLQEREVGGDSPLRLRGLPGRRGIAGRRRGFRARRGELVGWFSVVRRIGRWPRFDPVRCVEAE